MRAVTESPFKAKGGEGNMIPEELLLHLFCFLASHY
jgi:hypothetical protein